MNSEDLSKAWDAEETDSPAVMEQVSGNWYKLLAQKLLSGNNKSWSSMYMDR